ncbi:uncharacterized protein LOC120205199 [Hibiscus syriacus]|uniref:uncharacterized protein LOC120205199 n=1 Tax=Hibiscus syriacus TaxID=106335 RepID=UPI0019213AE3|nr:uncharacterized protein LOC120205199 [Hibiscus syriacus]
MANFKLLFTLCLHALFLISGSGTRLFRFHPLSIADQASKDQRLEINIDRYLDFKKISVATRSSALAVEAKGVESDRLRSSSKRALTEEGREAIRASMERHGGNPFESKRLSPGGPDPHHH